jgi:hypothetical protein
MRWRIFFICLSFWLNEKALPQSKVNLPQSFQSMIAHELKPFYAPSEGHFADLLKGSVISVSKVQSPSKNQQQLMLFSSGIHPRNCRRAMRKLSLYENYHQYMDFVKKSSYDEKKQKISLTIDHTLLPYPMILAFKIPRISGEGEYPFIFEDGFLKDLKGTIIVKKVSYHCLLGLKADWRGPDTPLPNLPFQVFLQTVGKVGLEHLIRVSLF